MNIQNLKTWQLVLIAVIYILYLCFVMFGGLRKRKVKAVKYAAMSCLLIYAVIKLFDGFYGSTAIINLLVITVIAFIKGIYLGHKKIIENVDNVFYIRHSKSYILWWLLFFTIKNIITYSLKFVTKAEIPVWHSVYYLALFYMIRSVTIFIVNPQLRNKNEVF